MIDSYNESFGFEIIDQCIRLGIEYFCIAPGSRSSALALAVANHPLAHSFIHLDERALGFHALGHAKASGKPVVIIVTSGTAVGNLLPSIMEAKESHIPLIILTADRPTELRNCGANQTTAQSNIFENHTKWIFDIPCSDPLIPQGFIGSILSYAYFISLQSPYGPVHLNCMFREPLHTTDSTFKKKESLSFPKHYNSLLILAKESVDVLKKGIRQAKHGMIFVGSLSNQFSKHAIIKLAESLNWPVACDISSSLRSYSDHPLMVRYFESKNNEMIDTVLYFGDRIVSKMTEQWLFDKNRTVYHINDHIDRFDPHCLLQHSFHGDLSWICEQLSHENSLFNEPIDLGSSESKAVFDEAYIFHFLSDFLPKEWNFFVGNSTPIRNADRFFYPKSWKGNTYVNRGVSGIDGNIATIAGISSATKTPMIGVIGDLTLLHDMGSLEQLKMNPYPVILFVINNQGGGIFSLLPIAKKRQELEKFFINPHTHTFGSLAKFFNLPYFEIKDKTNLFSCFDQLCQSPHSCIIELNINSLKTKDYASNH